MTLRRESFRSHIVYTLFVDTYKTLTRQAVTGKLVFVDLAHSLVDRSGAKASQRDMNPNPSLTLFRNVLQRVSERRPLSNLADEESILGVLLKDCLEGRGETM